MTRAKSVLIVDDNENIFKSLSLNFRQRGFDCRWAKNGAEALNAAGEADVALLDLSLGAEYGIDVMRDLLAKLPFLPIIIITGFGTFEAAVKAIKLGARDFLPKPLEFGKLFDAVLEAMRLPPSGRPEDGPEENPIIARNKEMQALCRRTRQFAKSELPILITGESGTGKELLATLAHFSSPRRGHPFLRINCSAFADSLVDNELFGHEKGSFTGAVQPHAGLFEQADRGTLHLDEIGDMSLASQAKILRALEEGAIRRIGGIADIRLDVRIIASTNKNLEALIGDDRFRQDLFYRLNAVTLHIPPLRERQDDIPVLLEHFLAEFAADGPKRSFSNEAVGLLAAYPWPGNVRELRNLTKVCCLISESDVIEADDLPDYVRHPAPATRSSRLNEAEREVIRRTLGECQGNKSLAAERLGISRRTLYNKMDRYGIG